MKDDGRLDDLYLIKLHNCLNMRSKDEFNQLLYWSINDHLPKNYLWNFTAEGTLCVTKNGQGCRIPMR